MVWMIGGKGPDKVSASIKLIRNRELVQYHWSSFLNYFNYLIILAKNYIKKWTDSRSALLLWETNTLLGNISNSYNNNMTNIKKQPGKQTTTHHKSFHTFNITLEGYCWRKPWKLQDFFVTKWCNLLFLVLVLTFFSKCLIYSSSLAIVDFPTFLLITFNVCPGEIVWNCYIQLWVIPFAGKSNSIGSTLWPT